VVVVATGLLTVLVKELELGTEPGLAVGRVVLISDVDGLFIGNTDLAELLVAVEEEVLTVLFF
jgi:hypothetical protein